MESSALELVEPLEERGNKRCDVDGRFFSGSLSVFACQYPMGVFGEAGVHEPQSPHNPRMKSLLRLVDQ